MYEPFRGYVHNGGHLDGLTAGGKTFEATPEGWVLSEAPHRCSRIRLHLGRRRHYSDKVRIEHVDGVLTHPGEHGAGTLVIEQ